MVCPHYEGDSRCAFKDKSYVLSTQQIANFCKYPGNEFTDCSIYKENETQKPASLALRRSVPPSDLERTSAQSLPKLTGNGDPARISIETRPEDHEFD